MEPAFAVDPGLFDHPGQSGLGHQEGAGEVDRDLPVPFGLVEQVHRPATGDARGVNEAVESVGDGLEDVGDRRFVGHIGRHEREPLAEVGGCGHIGAHDSAAFGQQALRGGQADARGSASHNKGARTRPVTHVGHGDHPNRSGTPVCFTRN